MTKKKVNIGLIGLGHLGRLYARDLATRIPPARLAAVADINENAVRQVAEEYDVPKSYVKPLDLLDDPHVEAVVIAAATPAHELLVTAAAQRGKAVFCEKPIALKLAEAFRMKKAIEHAGIFFQMGFMRRFDPGHLAAKQKIEEGLIGKAVVFKSTSRDPFPPPDEYVNPDVCGGFLIDSGIHDFDSARWLFGEIDTVHAIGGALVVDVFKRVGDVDNAIVSLKFTNGKLGVIDLSVHATYGYDISTDILGSRGAIRIGYLRETPILTMTENNIGHDVVQLFDNRFAEAYVLQLQNFAENVLNGRRPPVTIDDGIEALRVALAAEHSLRTGQPVKVSSITEDVT